MILQWQPRVEKGYLPRHLCCHILRKRWIVLADEFLVGFGQVQHQLLAATEQVLYLK